MLPHQDCESSNTKVTISFTLHKDGKATEIRVCKASGLSIVDEDGLKAIQIAAPFRPLPEDAPAAVVVEYTFDYEVLSGHRSF